MDLLAGKEPVRKPLSLQRGFLLRTMEAAIQRIFRKAARNQQPSWTKFRRFDSGDGRTPIACNVSSSPRSSCIDPRTARGGVS